MNYSVDKKDYDYILILGSGLKGEKISYVLQQRLDKALELIPQNTSAKILVSGGQGPGEDISEALAMKKYLCDHSAIFD